MIFTNTLIPALLAVISLSDITSAAAIKTNSTIKVNPNGGSLHGNITFSKATWAHATKLASKAHSHSIKAPKDFKQVKPNTFQSTTSKDTKGLWTTSLITSIGVAITGNQTDPKKPSHFLLHSASTSKSNQETQWKKFSSAVKAAKLQHMRGYISYGNGTSDVVKGFGKEDKKLLDYQVADYTEKVAKLTNYLPLAVAHSMNKAVEGKGSSGKMWINKKGLVHLDGAPANMTAAQKAQYKKMGLEV